MLTTGLVHPTTCCVLGLPNTKSLPCSGGQRPAPLLCGQRLRTAPLQKRKVHHQKCRSYRATVCAAGAAIHDPYKVLGIDSSANDQVIKRAFKQKAKQLHPDVNKQPDAADRFMECKMAYQLLTDPSKRKQYDRQHQAGFDWGDFVDGMTGGASKQRKQEAGEPFYGFTDFLRDLDVDLKRWSDQVDKKGFKSLFDELYDAGLLAVGALEKGLGLSTEEVRRRTADASASSSSASSAAAGSGSTGSQQPGTSRKPSRPTPEEEAESVRQKVQAFEREAEQKKQQAEKEVDDMLADLKKRLNER